MLLPVYIVAVREIRAEVPPTTLFAPQRRPRDQQADRHKARLTTQVSIGGSGGTDIRHMCPP